MHFDVSYNLYKWDNADILFYAWFLIFKNIFWDATFTFMSVLIDHSFLCYTLFMKRCSASLKTENSKLKLHRNTVFIYQIDKI